MRQIFQSGLETVVCGEGSSECQRDLIDADDGSLRLELTLSLSVFSVVWNQKICVEMKAVTLEPIQYAEAKIRDLEERLEAIAADKEQDRVTKENRRVLLLEYASSNSTTQIHDVLQWKRSDFDVNSKHFLVQPNGCVTVRTGGCYVISLVIHHSYQKSIERYFEVRWGMIYSLFTVAFTHSTSLLSKIVRFEEGTTMKVVSKVVTGVVKATLSIMPAV